MENPWAKVKGKTIVVGDRGETASSSAQTGCTVSTYIWAKLHSMACRPLSVWLMTVTGQTSNQHSLIPSLAIGKKKCPFFCNHYLWHILKSSYYITCGQFWNQTSIFMFSVAPLPSFIFKWCHCKIKEATFKQHSEEIITKITHKCIKSQ